MNNDCGFLGLFCSSLYAYHLFFVGDIRNDLYVTLMQGEFRKGGKVADKNVEVTLTVLNEDGEVIEVKFNGR